MNRYTIQHMRQWASDHGGKCLSKEYWGMDRELVWRCEKGHTWDAYPSTIRQGIWCVQCLKKYKDKEARLEAMKSIAKERGGECLSKEYINSITKIQFKCSEGHSWMMPPHSIQSGQWCPKCGIKKRTEKRKTPIAVFHKIAKQNGGKLLSDNYINGHTKLLWQCRKGHQWRATGAMVVHAESWCPYCQGMYKNIKDMQDLAAKRGGKCLSKKYINTSTKLKWQCSKGHIWKSAPNNVISNCWCPTCGYEIATEKQKDDIGKYRKIARERGGKLVSEKYINNRTPLVWECKKGHQWKARPLNIQHQKTWCPYCYGNHPGLSRNNRTATNLTQHA